MSSLLAHGMKEEKHAISSQISIRKLGEKQFSKAKMSVDQRDNGNTKTMDELQRGNCVQ